MRDTNINLHQLQPILRVGKAGLTEGIVTQLTKTVRVKKVVKVKFLKSSFEDSSIQELAQTLAEKCDAHVIQRVGFVVTYGRN